MDFLFVQHLTQIKNGTNKVWNTSTNLPSYYNQTYLHKYILLYIKSHFIIVNPRINVNLRLNILIFIKCYVIFVKSFVHLTT